jgi:hypothetical protein
VRAIVSTVKVMYAEHANHGGQQTDGRKESQCPEKESKDGLVIHAPFSYRQLLTSTPGTATRQADDLPVTPSFRLAGNR